MASLIRSAGLDGAAGAFFSWWTGELAALVPAQIRRPFRSRSAVVVLGATSLVVRERHGDAETAVLELRTGPGEAPETGRLARAIRRFRARGWPIDVELADDALLRDRIHLPAAVRENLREAVSYQLDRLTPFTPEEVLFDCRLAGEQASRERLTVELLVAPRAVVDRALERLSVLGVEADTVSFAGDGPGRRNRFDLLAGTRKRPRRTGWRATNVTLCCLALLLAAAAVMLPFERDRRLIAALEQQVAVARAEAETARKLTDDIADRRRTVGFIAARKAATVPATILIERLSELLPDDSWVTQLRVSQGVVRVVGQAASAAELIRLIESAPGFEGARLESPARRDPKTGRERFNLSFRVLRPEG